MIVLNVFYYLRSLYMCVNCIEVLFIWKIDISNYVFNLSLVCFIILSSIVN